MIANHSTFLNVKNIYMKKKTKWKVTVTSDHSGNHSHIHLYFIGVWGTVSCIRTCWLQGSGFNAPINGWALWILYQTTLYCYLLLTVIQMAFSPLPRRSSNIVWTLLFIRGSEGQSCIRWAILSAAWCANLGKGQWTLNGHLYTTKCIILI